MNRLAAVTLAGLIVAAGAPVAHAAQAPQSRPSISAASQARLISLPRGSSMSVDLPADARDVIVPNPVVAEAMLHSPRRPWLPRPCLVQSNPTSRKYGEDGDGARVGRHRFGVMLMGCR